MGAEIGATTSLFPFNDRMYDYLAATRRKDIGDFARVYAKELREDEGAEVRENISLFHIASSHSLGGSMFHAPGSPFLITNTLLIC
jgi:Aconitase family (aconitate hydratase)